MLYEKFVCPYHKGLTFKDLDDLNNHMKLHWNGLDLHFKPDGDTEVI